MRIAPYFFEGVFVIDIEPAVDERGFFARIHCEQEFAAHGLVSRFSQTSISFNSRRGTVRGMHFAGSPQAETKLVRCTSGVIHDVIVDIRRNSPTYMQSASITLSAKNHRAIYIPSGFAHGFQTRCDETQIIYSIDIPYVASSASGIRWNDPALFIDWPEPITVISPRDLQFPDWTP